MRASRQRVCLSISFAFLLGSLAAGAAELFGVSVCFFGTPLHAYLAIPICFFSVLFCILLCMRVRGSVVAKGGKTVQAKLLCALLCILCAVFVCITVSAAALTATHYTGQCISEDKAYKVFYETETEDAEPIAHLYRRHSPFLMSYRNSAVLYGFAGDIFEVEAEWGETACTLYYVGYPEEAESADDLQTLTRKLYYTPSERV